MLYKENPMTEYEQNIEVMKDLRARIDKVLEGQPVPTEVEYRHPDPVKHKYISFAKSGVRIAAGIALCYSMFWYAGGLLILAEVLGIAEEVV
jgi:hypothetical protein